MGVECSVAPIWRIPVTSDAIVSPGMFGEFEQKSRRIENARITDVENRVSKRILINPTSKTKFT
jgi:hypothetical protein